MAVAPRQKSKATKIAYNILGVPDNIKNAKKKPSKVNRRLVFEETSLVR